MKIRNKVAAVFLALSVLSSHAVVFAGMPMIAYAEETVSDEAESNTVVEQTTEESTTETEVSEEEQNETTDSETDETPIVDESSEESNNTQTQTEETPIVDNTSNTLESEENTNTEENGEVAALFSGASASSNSNSASEKPGKIIIRKQTIGEEGTFDFNGDLGDFSITTYNIGSYYGIGEKVFNNVTPGVYNVTEVLPEGWSIWDINCNSETPEVVSGNVLTLTVDPGKTTSCTFTNKKGASEEDTEKTTVHIVASKVVCDDPSDMPRWGNYGPSITANTAQDYVASHDSCRLVSGWNFQWGFGDSVVNGAGVRDPGSSFYGSAPTGSAHDAWKDVPQATNANGVTTFDVTFDKGTEGRIWVREVLKTGFEDFAGVVTETNEVSAELYCHEDVLHFDNYDYVQGLTDGATYNCVAFNIPVDNGGESMCIDSIVAEGDDAPINFGISSGIGEKTVIEILADNGYNVATTTDQKGYERWVSAKDVTYEVELLGFWSAGVHEFGFYDAGTGIATMQTVFRTGTSPFMTATSAPVFTPGDKTIIHIPANKKIGFAINAFNIDRTPMGFYTTENLLNADNQSDHAAVYEIENGYVIAFEDLNSTIKSDYDYNDVVVAIRAIACEDPTIDPKGIDLSVSKTASVATTTTNASFTYTISVTNNGPETAEDVIVTDMLPTGVIFENANTTLGSYATSTGIWTVGNVAASATETLMINVKVASTTTGNIVNTATATTTTPQTDNNPENNTGTSTVIVDNGGNGGSETGIDLAVSKTASLATTTVGTQFTYTISVTNQGPEDAEGVSVTDILPAGIVFESATTTLGSYATSTGIWTVGDLASSTTQTLTISVTASTTGSISNTATATSTGNKTDNDTSNNSSTVTVTIEDDNGTGGGESGIDISVTKQASINEVNQIGVEFTYTITVSNGGPDVAEGVTVTDVLPSSISLISATSTTGSYATSTGIWTVGDLAPNQNETLTLRVSTVSVENDIVNTATGTTTIPQTDNNPGNNTGTSTVSVPGDGGNNGGGNGGSGGGGGGGGRSSSNDNDDDDIVVPQQCEYLKEFLRYGYNNNPVEVVKLQAFLNAFEGEGLNVDGFFDLATDAAVRRFQVKYFGDILEPWGHTDSTGYVYILTKKKVNEIFCNRAFPVTPGEAQEIVEFRAFLESLRARGIDTTPFEGGIGGNPEEGGEEIAGGTETSGGLRDFLRDIFGGSDEEDETATTTEGSLAEGNDQSRFVETISNLAAAALIFPGNASDAVNCLIVLLIILAIIYVLSTIIVNGMSENQPVEVIRGRKIVAFMVGVVGAIIIALIVPYPCIILPLILILIALAIWWAVRRGGDGDDRTDFTQGSMGDKRKLEEALPVNE